MDPFPVVGNAVGFGEEMADWVLDMLSVKGFRTDVWFCLRIYAADICFVV